MTFGSLDQTCHLRRFGQELVFVGERGAPPPGYELIKSDGEHAAERFVRDLCREPQNLRALEKLAGGSLLGQSAVSGGEATTIDFVARAWARGEYRLYGAPRPEAKEPEKEPVDVAPPVINRVREKSFLSVRLVVDATDDPVSDVQLIAEFPNRSKKEAKTDRGGRIDVDFEGYGPATLLTSIKDAKQGESLVYVRTAATPSHGAKDPGDAELTGKPLVNIVKYRVRTGDTLEAIAKGYGITKDDLVMFNFGTTDEDEVDQRLFYEVGCRRRRADQRVVMDSTDQPGIIYVPKPLRLPGLALNTLHIVRVTLASREGAFVFSC